MSFTNFVELIDDQTINAAIVNGAGQEIKDCIIGSDTGGLNPALGTYPLYIVAGVLKSYTFTGILNGYYFSFAADAAVGTGAAGTNYIHVAYIETSDAGVEGRVAGSKSSVDFSLVISASTATPTGYDGSMVIGVGEYSAQWDSLYCYILPPRLFNESPRWTPINDFTYIPPNKNPAGGDIAD